MNTIFKQLSIALSLAFVLIQPANAATVHATWMYNFSVLDNIQTLDRLNTLKINRVYLGVDAKKLLPNGENAALDYTSKLQQFVALANANDIEVHAMTLMNNQFFLTAQHNRALELVSWIVDYQANVPVTERFAGIHIDTEPHTLQAWKDAKAANDWATVESLMQEFVGLLNKLEPVIHAAVERPEFSAALQWKYNEWADQGLLPSGDASLLASFLDVLVPMVYETDDVNLIQSRAQDELNEAPTLVGIKADSFTKYTELTNAQKKLDRINKRNSNYLGSAVYYFSTLSKLAPN